MKYKLYYLALLSLCIKSKMERGQQRKEGVGEKQKTWVERFEKEKENNL